MAPELVTVFDIRHSPFPWSFATGGIWGAAAAIALGAYQWKATRRRAGGLMVIFGLVFGLVWILGPFKSAYSERADAMHRYDSGYFATVEGPVHDFQPMPWEGHQEECFSVGSQQFCYSDFMVTPGFHQSASHGGPIREGLYVRVAYNEGTIYKLEVDTLSAPSVSHAAEVARSAQIAGEKRMDADPQVRQMNLIFALTAVSFTFLWNWKWRIYIRAYGIKNPQSWFAYPLRAFAAVCLLSASWHLIQQVRQPYSLNDYARDLFISAAISVALYSITVWMGTMAFARDEKARQRELGN